MSGRMGSRRGNAVLTALSLTCLLGFGALAVDIAYTQVARLQLSTALDAGTLGGSAYLDGTLVGVQTAVAKAVELANANLVYGGGAGVAATDVIVGYYKDSDGTYTVKPMPTTDEDAVWINVIQLKVTKTGIDSILAGAAFNQSSLSAYAESTAYRDIGGSAGAVDCYLPIVFPSCLFETASEAPPTANPDPIQVVLGSAPVDNGAWSTFESPTNPNTVIAQLQGSCDGAQLDQYMNLINGGPSPIITATEALLDATPAGVVSTWPYDMLPAGPPADPAGRDGVHAYTVATSAMSSTNWGNVIGGPIALVDVGGDPVTCDGAANFNQAQPIVGFTYGYIFDVRTSGSVSQRGVFVQLDFLNEYEMGDKVPGGDAVGNITYPPVPPKLIEF